MSRIKKLSNLAILFLSVLGCLVTLVLLYEHFKPAADIGCSAVGGNCQAANESKYGHVGPIPTSAIGLGMYLTFLGICLKRKKLISLQTVAPTEDGTAAAQEPAGIKLLDTAAFAIALPAVCISVWLQKISLFDLFSFCPYCMSSCIFVLIITILTARDLFVGNGKLQGEQKLLVGTFGFIGAMTIFMGLPELMRQIELIRRLPPVRQAGPIKPKRDMPPVVLKDMHVIGDDAAPYLVVEFADYQCNHCKKANEYLHQVMAKNPGRYKLAFRNYPLPIHNWAAKAALAAEAAAEQGKFWEMHDLIFEHQMEMEAPTFKQDTFKQWAVQLGLDVDKFSTDMLSDKITMRVATDATAAPQLEVKQTPSFFIIHGSNPPYMLSGNDQLRTAMDDPNNAAWK